MRGTCAAGLRSFRGSPDRVTPGMPYPPADHRGDVRNRLADAPTWVLAPVAGLGFAVTNTLTRLLLLDDPWTEAVVISCLSGLLFGAFMGPVLVRQRRRAREAAGTASAAGWRRAARAASRGPVPRDPEERQAARRLALHQRGVLLRQRRWAIPSFALLVAIAVWLAVSGDPVYWLVAVGFAWLAGWTSVVLPRRLARRVELLTGPS